MSTILKALRRIEDDKAPPPGARPLREEVAAVPGEPLSRRPFADGRALWLGGALALVLLVLVPVGGALWLSRGEGEEPARAMVEAPARILPGPRADAAGAASPVAERTAAPPAPARRSPPEASGAGAASPSAEGRAATDRAGRSTEGRGATEISGPSTEAGAATDIARRSAEAPATAPPPRDPAPVDRGYAAAETGGPSAPAAPRPAPEPAPPPATSDPEPAVRHIMPELTVAGTVWHPDPGRRTAEIELAGRGEPLTLREGDAVGSLVVKAIEPSGVVFRMGEVEVRRRVGE